MCVFCGIDCAEQHHDAALVDTNGTLIAKARASPMMLPATSSCLICSPNMATQIPIRYPIAI